MNEIEFIDAPNNFYLGARVNPQTHEIIPSDVEYYDARDLTTHGVILGMTGSGKTGLGVTLLEEAALDGIPCLIIDPKGDITNMLLAFPEMKAQYFEPWVNPEDALRNDNTIQEQAEAVAKRWSEGLERWGIKQERIENYRRAARFSIYTPGSTAGLPISILQSLAAPAEGWDGNEEILRERISGIVSALLALIGINARPVEDREHILLSNIFESNWRAGKSLSMEQLILQTQRPPFTKLGVLELESIFPEKDRAKLAQALNNIMAAPNFQTWIQGEPLHIPSLLFTPEGYPRVTIFYTAHLNDAERQFINTLLLEAIHGWMRTLSGSTSLRALLYIDEVVGMFPPHPYNPPTKDPMLRLLKQGRAFGLGVVVATQNPKDIDYKGLSNAGTWFIGKLQTDNDKDRVLEGLDSARDATSALDIKTVDNLLGRLGPREFILHNVHEPDTPHLMHTRWAISYLRGPLTRDEVSRLMKNQRGLSKETVDAAEAQALVPGHQQAAQGTMPQQPPVDAQGMPAAAPPAQPAPADPVVQPRGVLPPTFSGTPPQGGTPVIAQPPQPASRPAVRDEPPAGFVGMVPSMPSSVTNFYLPTEYGVEQAVHYWENWTRQNLGNVQTGKRLLYRPSLLAQSVVRYMHRPTNTSETYYYSFVAPNLPRTTIMEWGNYATEPFDPQALETQPFKEAFYEELPDALKASGALTSLRDNLIDWIYYNSALYVYHNPVLKLYSGLNEDKQAFVARMQAVAREQRDAEVDTVASRYDDRLEKIEERAQRKAIRLDSQRDQLNARRREELITGAESLWQLMQGRAYYTLSRTSRMRRYTNQSEDSVSIAERDLMQLADQLAETEAEMEAALQEVQAKWTDAVRQIKEIRISPYKKDIDVMQFGIGWVPYWDVQANGQRMILPASSSTIVFAQNPQIYGQGGGPAGALPGASSW